MLGGEKTLMTSNGATTFSPRIAARIERLPLSPWHVRIGLIISTCWFFDGFDALAIAYVLPALIRPWHLSSMEIGLMIAAGYAGQTIGSIYFGWLAERVGRVPVCFYTLLLWSLMSVACAFAWDYRSLAVMRFAQGIGLGGEIPIMAAYINEFAGSRRRGRFSVSYQIFFTVGLIIVAFVARWVVPHWGWRAMFIIGAAPALVSLPLRRVLPESPRWLASRGRIEEADRTLTRIETIISRGGKRALPPIPTDVREPTPAATHFGDLFKGIYKRRSFSVWVLWVSSYLVVYGLSTWMPSLWVTVYHLSVQQALNYATIAAAFPFFSFWINIWFLDYFGRKPLFATALLVSAFPLTYLGLHATELAPPYVLALTMFAFYCNAILAGFLSTYTAELYPTTTRALGTGVGNAWLRFASVVGPFSIGLIVPAWGLDAVFLLMAVAVVIGGLICILFCDETCRKVLEHVSPTPAA
jgi:MFS transporter, putative metabolite:H+ symporter